jgi:hypothetical protein
MKKFFAAPETEYWALLMDSLTDASHSSLFK